MHLKNRLPLFLVILFFLIIYSLSTTLVPTGIADADELTLTSYLFSVSHPPGFPLFTLVGNLGIKFITQFTHPAHAANLLSALYASISIGLFFLITRQLSEIIFKKYSPTQKLFISFVATGITGFSYFIWSYATIYEITSFTSMLTTGLIYSALKWYLCSNAIKSKPLYYQTYILAGLLLSHFHLAILIFPALLWLLISKESFKLKPFILGISILIFTVIASSLTLFLANSSSTFSWNAPLDLSSWWSHITRKDYEGIDLESSAVYTSAFALPTMFDSVSVKSVFQFFGLLISHYNYLSIILMLMGLIFLWKNHRPLFWFFGLLFLFSGPTLAAYMRIFSYTFETSRFLGIAERHLILAEISAGLLIFPGLALIKFKKGWIYVSILLVIFQFYQNQAILTQSYHRSFNYHYLKDNLTQLAPNALVICTTDIDCYGLWYLNLVDQVRPDVAVLSQTPVYRNNFLKNNPQIYPFDNFTNPEYFTFLLAYNYPFRPIYLTGGINFYDSYLGLENGPFYLQPENHLFRLQQTPPDNITYFSTSTNIQNLVNSLDKRNLYPLGIIESIANRQAYAGYLALKYNQPQVATQYLHQAKQLDPKSSQIQELNNQQSAIAESIKLKHPIYTSTTLVNLANQAIEVQDYPQADIYFRYAYLLDSHNPQVINSAIDFYSQTDAIVTTTMLQQLLHLSSTVYNNQQIMPE